MQSLFRIKQVRHTRAVQSFVISKGEIELLSIRRSVVAQNSVFSAVFNDHQNVFKNHGHFQRDLMHYRAFSRPLAIDWLPPQRLFPPTATILQKRPKPHTWKRQKQRQRQRQSQIQTNSPNVADTATSICMYYVYLTTCLRNGKLLHYWSDQNAHVLYHSANSWNQLSCIRLNCLCTSFIII